MEDIDDGVEIYENDDYDIGDIIIQGGDKDINQIMKNQMMKNQMMKNRIVKNQIMKNSKDLVRIQVYYHNKNNHYKFLNSIILFDPF